MSTLGMWQPKQKDGKNWIVRYTVEALDGAKHGQSRKFRVRSDAYDFIEQTKRLLPDVARVPAIQSFTYKVSKL